MLLIQLAVCNSFGYHDCEYVPREGNVFTGVCQSVHGGVVGMFRELAMSREWEPTPQDMGPGIPRNAGGTHFTGMLSCIIFRSLFLAHRYPSQGISRETKRTENSWNIFTIFSTVVSVTM